MICHHHHQHHLDASVRVEEDLDEELWEAKDLKIPVYNTEDGISLSLSNLGAYWLIFLSIGFDMRELELSITRSLCDQFLLRLFIGLKPQISQRLPLMPSLWSRRFERYWVIDGEEPLWSWCLLLLQVTRVGRR